MGLEILAGRIVAPALGSSVYVWGSVIGVFLTALSVGYYLGGKRAATHASRESLSAILLAGVGFTALLIVAGEPLLGFFAGLPIPARYAAIPPIIVLFGPMTVLLGLLSPFAAELSQAQSSGESAGRVFALGTVGSIVGTFGATFVLIPFLSVLQAELVFGGILLAGAFRVAPAEPRAVAQVGLAACVLLAAALVGVYGVPTPANVVHEESTRYSELRVVDDDGVRTMFLDGVPQSAMYTDEREGYVFGYSAYAHIPLLMTEDVDRVLFVGGGGFSGPKRFLEEYPNVTVDVVELDPAVVDAAYTYFDVPRDHPRLSVHTMDGRRFLKETTHTYDLIVLDAFRKDRVPFHLTTREFMALTSSKMDDDGVLFANVIAARSGQGSAFYRAEVKTLGRVYPHVYAFPTSNTNALQNIELVATKGEPYTEAELQRANEERDIGLDLTRQIRRYQRGESIPTDDVPVLTDDHAPVDRLLDEGSGQRYVITGYNGTTDRARLGPRAVSAASVV
ncbi:spermidine synthase [Natronomonas sp. EA1]|uniref:spermidine synthase n=1 Tax=Natronomonas sp. EA1 TaxID=3421655 RepID=UPI003EB73EDA